MSEANGPYELGDKLPMSRDSYMTLETETKTAIANAAWLEGRASRDGLSKSLEKYGIKKMFLDDQDECGHVWEFDWSNAEKDFENPRDSAKETLEADGEGQ